MRLQAILTVSAILTLGSTAADRSSPVAGDTPSDDVDRCEGEQA